MVRRIVLTTAAAAMVGAVSLAGAATAAAAPSGGMSASEVINQLQASGNNVVVNKIGSGSSCEVISVRPVTMRQAPMHPGLRSPAMIWQPRTTFHVFVKC
jgi:hypothetical protein